MLKGRQIKHMCEIGDLRSFAVVSNMSLMMLFPPSSYFHNLGSDEKFPFLKLNLLPNGPIVLLYYTTEKLAGGIVSLII